MLNIQQILTKNEMFAALSRADREHIAPSCVLERVRQGKQIHETETTQPVIVVGHGLLKTIVGTPGTVEPVVRLHEPGDLANDIQLLDPCARQLRVIAITEAAVVLVPRELVLEALEHSPKAALELAGSTAKAAGEAYSRISSARYSVEERTAAALLQLADDYGDEMEGGRLKITLPLKRTELAGYVGSTTESVIRALSRWKKDGTISLDERCIEILNRRVLESASIALRQYHASA
jgi:CRP-like cAMP-binding protein